MVNKADICHQTKKERKRKSNKGKHPFEKILILSSIRIKQSIKQASCNLQTDIRKFWMKECIILDWVVHHTKSNLKQTMVTASG